MGNFFYKLRCAMARFMYGRNGVDQLSWAMVVLGVALSLIGSLVGIPLVTSILSYVNLAIWIVLLYRMFSRNLEKRRREHARFMAWWAYAAMPFNPNSSVERRETVSVSPCQSQPGSSPAAKPPNR